MLSTPDLLDWMLSGMADALGEIAVGNELAIKALVQLLSTPDLNDWQRFYAAEVLGMIAVGNELAIEVLVQLVPNLDYHLRGLTAWTLEKILTPKITQLAIGQLTSYCVDEAYNYNQSQFESCYEIFFKCSRILSYSDYCASLDQFNYPT
jgi:hypothetical protein